MSNVSDNADPERSSDQPNGFSDLCGEPNQNRRGRDLVESAEKISLAIYPNPVAVRSKVKVQVSTSGIYTITLTDISGRIQYNRSLYIRKDSGELLSVDITGNPGLYFIQVKGAGFAKTEKIFKAR